MKDLTTKEFCREFCACKEGAKFARKYKTMLECYAALLRGEAGANSYGWALWVATRKDVMSERALRLFAVRCARSVQHLMTYEPATRALDVAEHYANGEASREELAAASAAARAAQNAAAWASDAVLRATCETGTADDAAYGASNAALEAADAAQKAFVLQRNAQFSILAELGNPFMEVKNE